MTAWPKAWPVVPTHPHTTPHPDDRADKYGDLPLGLYLVRGDAMVMLGEVDPAREAGNDLTKVSSDVSKGKGGWMDGWMACRFGRESMWFCRLGREGRCLPSCL